MHGYIEGQDLVVDYRAADGRNDRLADFAAELVRLPVDILVTGGPAATRVARNATSTIPIVMVFPGDAVASGLVASLARPGGNVTGVSTFFAQLTQKRLELLKETLPGLSRVAVLWTGDGVDPTGELRDIEVAAQVLGVQPLPFEVREAADLAGALQAAVAANAGAPFPLSGAVFFANS